MTNFVEDCGLKVNGEAVWWPGDSVFISVKVKVKNWSATSLVVYRHNFLNTTSTLKFVHLIHACFPKSMFRF